MVARHGPPAGFLIKILSGKRWTPGPPVSAEKHAESGEASAPLEKRPRTGLWRNLEQVRWVENGDGQTGGSRNTIPSPPEGPGMRPFRLWPKETRSFPAKLSASPLFISHPVYFSFKEGKP